MKNTLLLFLLLFSIIGYGQTGPQSTWWDSTYAGVSKLPSTSTIRVSVVEVLEAPGGSIYVLVKSFDGSQDVIQLIKYNSAGIEQFSQTYTGTSDETPIGMGLDNSENIYIVSDSGDNYARVTKYNSSGSLLWTTKYGGAITLVDPTAMIVDAATGDVYFTGSLELMTTSENENVLIVKYDNAGNFIWASNYNSTTDGIDIGHSLVKDNSGNVYVGAKEKTTVPIMLKFNSAGTQQWQISSVGENQIHLVGTNRVGVYGRNDYGEYFTSSGSTSNTINFDTPLFSGAVTFHKTSDGSFIRLGSAGKIGKFDNTGTTIWGYIKNNYNESISYLDPYDDLIVIDRRGTPTKMGATHYEGSTGFSTWNYEFTGRNISTTSNLDNRIAYTATSDNSMIIARAFYISSTEMKVYVNKFCIPPRITSVNTVPASPGNLCHNDTIQVESSSTFGNNYTWSATNGFFPTPNNQNTDFVAVNGNSFGVNATITLTVDYNGCSSEQTLSPINVYSAVPSDIDFFNVPTCEGEYGTLSASSTSASYTYEWFIDGVSQGVSTNDSIVVTQSGLYELEVTHTTWGCVSDRTGISVGLSPAPMVVANASSLSVCNGESVTLSGSGTAASYGWDNGVTNGVAFAPSTTTTYTVTGTSSSGCSATDQVTVAVNALPTVSASASSTSICEGENTTLDATGADTYLWDNGLGSGASQPVSPIVTTTYSVTGTDGNGCENTDNITITVNSLPTANAGADQSICTGSATTISASGGVTYSWDNGLGSGVSHLVSPTSSTTYNVTVTDANGCIDSDNLLVTVNALPVINLGPDQQLCFGNTATLDAGSGFSNYNWSTTENTQTILAPASGIYSVTVTDGNGCQNSDDVNITINPEIIANPNSTDATCGNSDGSASVAPTGGSGSFTYSWNPIPGTGPGISAVPSGSYSVTITDAAGCQIIETIVINDLGGPTLSGAGTNVNCEGGNDGSATVTTSGGSSPFNYLWDDPLAQTTSTAVNLEAGTYSVTVIDNNGCTSIETVIISFDNPNPTIFLGNDTTICQMDVLTLDAGNGFSYLWSDGSSGQTLSVTTTGDYSVEITDGNGCTGIDTIAIAVELCTGLSDYRKNRGINIYPNPGKGLINITIPSGEKIKAVELYSLDGRLILNQQQGTPQLNLDHLPANQYLLKVLTSDSSYQQIVVIQ